MIRTLSLIAGRGNKNPLGSTIVLAVLAAIAQGVAAVLIVPAIRALFDSPGRAVRWIIILVVAFIVQAVLLALATWDGFKGSLRIIDVMHERLGRRLVKLPQSWFDGEAPARASQITVSGTMFVATVSMDVVVPLRQPGRTGDDRRRHALHRLAARPGAHRLVPRRVGVLATQLLGRDPRRGARARAAVDH